MAQPGQFEVGQLYLGFNRNGLPVWKQPGGIGTTVYPQLPRAMSWFGEANDNTSTQYQWPLAYPSQYVFGCGHPMNCPEIYSYYDPYEEEIMALICCSQCSYIQQIMSLVQYQNYIQTPLVVA